MTGPRQQLTPTHRGGTSCVSVSTMPIALLAQCVVLAGTFLMGIGWGGLTWLLALAQAGGALWAIVWLGRRRSWWALFVPFLSAAATAGLLLAVVSYTKATECNAEGVAAMAEIDHPRGLVMDFTGSMHNGCLAHDYTSMPARDVIAHYTDELTRNGWTLEPPDGETMTAERDGVRVYIEAVPVEDGLVLITIS